MTQARRTAGIVARAALWATWAAAMVFAPAAMHYFGYVESVPAGWEHLFDLWFFVPWSAAPVFALAVAALHGTKNQRSTRCSHPAGTDST